MTQAATLSVAPAVIHVVDDEAPLRRSLLFLLESVGWQAVGHESAEAFLAASPPYPPLPAGGGCLVLDVRMPRISGLELQRRLRAAASPWPIIFITGHGDVELAVEAMKNGAVDFLQKPFKDQVFLDTVEQAVQLSRTRQAETRRHQDARDLLQRLSQRELEVARLVARGLANKEVGRALGISENTVHVHRQHAMEKTGAGNVADLVRLFLLVEPDGVSASPTPGPAPTLSP